MRRSNQNGTSLLDILITTAVSAIVFGLLTISLERSIKSIQTLNQSGSILELRSHIVDTLNNTKAWTNTIQDPRNSVLDCLKPLVNSSFFAIDCKNKSGSFVLKNAQDQDMYNATSSDQGLTANGSPCTLKLNGSNYVPTAACPIRLDLTWKAHCDPTAVVACTTPQNVIEGVFTQYTGGNHLAIANLDFKVLKNSPKVLAAAPVKPMTSFDGANGCVILLNGEVRCWGDNRSGQINAADATTVYFGARNYPGLSEKAVNVGSGSSHICVVLESGRVMCSGSNGGSALGRGTYPTTPGSIPYYHSVFTAHHSPGYVVDVAGQPIDDVKMVSSGSGGHCAVKNSGKVVCWGSNKYGKLGIGIARYDSGGKDVWALAPMPQNPIVDANGDWTGDYGLIPYAVEAKLDPGDIAVDITTSTVSTCVKLKSNIWKCWGDNEFGELGRGFAGITNPNDPNDLLSLPTPIAGLDGSSPSKNVLKVDQGIDHACAVMEDTTLKCWGRNQHAQLGLGFSGANILVPTTVPGLTGIVDVGAGQYHTCALNTSGEVYCWGYNGYADLGLGYLDTVTAGHPNPVKVPNLGGEVIAIMVGTRSTFAFMKDGGVKSWGNNYWVGGAGQPLALNAFGNYSILAPTDLAGLTEPIVPPIIGSGASNRSPASAIGSNGAKSPFWIF